MVAPPRLIRTVTAGGAGRSSVMEVVSSGEMRLQRLFATSGISSDNSDLRHSSSSPVVFTLAPRMETADKRLI